MKRHEVYIGSGIDKDALKKKDGSYGVLVLTIKDVTTAEFDDGNKRCLSFEEDDRSFSLNGTNWDTIAEITGKDDDDEWPGTKIEIYFDPSVMFKGKKTGGMRVRKPTGAAATRSAAPASSPADGPPDDGPPDAAGDTQSSELEAVKDKAGAWAFFKKYFLKQGKTQDEINALWTKKCQEQGKPQAQFGPDNWYAVASAAEIPF